MSNQRIERMRSEARARTRQQQERIERGKVKVPTNAEANAVLGSYSMKSQNEAALKALGESRDAGRDRLIAAHTAADDMEAMPSGLEALDALIDRLEAGEPGLDDKLTAHQRMTIGRRQKERQLEAEIAEEDASGGA